MRFSTSALGILIALTSSVIPTSGDAAEHRIPANGKNLVVRPFQHAGFSITWDNTTVLVDPLGKAPLFDGLSPPDLILITDTHEDHMDVDALKAIDVKRFKSLVEASVPGIEVRLDNWYPLGI